MGARSEGPEGCYSGSMLDKRAAAVPSDKKH